MTGISVIVPLYNHGEYIEAALASVADQLSSTDEIIVLDDGSSDNGPQRARTALNGCANARVLIQANAGAHVTINRLFAMAKGDHVAILNSDDRFAKTKLDRCRAVIAADPTVDLIVGEAQIINEQGKIQRTGTAVEWMTRALGFRDEHNLPQLSLLYENWVATTSNMVVSNHFWRTVGGFRNLRYCHDLDFLMTAFASGRVVIDRGTTHIQYRVHPRNTIAESLDRIRLEIAAVWANALFEAGPRLIGGSRPEGVSPFMTALESKGLTALICLLQAFRTQSESPEAFYDSTLRNVTTTTAFLKHLR